VFHTLVHMSTFKVILVSALFIIFSWLVVAVLFYLMARGCGLEPKNGHDFTFVMAIYLAIETVETIGYGVPDNYFHSCGSGIFVLGVSALWASLLNAITISLVYTRVSRANVRASSVCFSERAVLSQLDGKIYFMLQVCDFQKHQLCEAHVRLYCVQHSDTASGPAFQLRAMRLQHPDDQLGGSLLLVLPQLVVHRIDQWSPLSPQECRTCDGCVPTSSFQLLEVPQRAGDGENGNRVSGPPNSTPEAPSIAQIARHLAEGKCEVLCFVEGIDPTTSGTLQARHSYTCDDIVFNASFKRCVHGSLDEACEIDFDRFHDLELLRPQRPW